MARGEGNYLLSSPTIRHSRGEGLSILGGAALEEVQCGRNKVRKAVVRGEKPG